jgi:hypothetical protein
VDSLQGFDQITLVVVGYSATNKTGRAIPNGRRLLGNPSVPHLRGINMISAVQLTVLDRIVISCFFAANEASTISRATSSTQLGSQHGCSTGISGILSERHYYPRSHQRLQSSPSWVVRKPFPCPCYAEIGGDLCVHDHSRLCSSPYIPI